MEIRMHASSQRSKYRSNYSPQEMADAYNYVIDEGAAVQKAATKFGVPITTLKDRVKGRISIDTVKSGGPMFSQEHEALLCQHLNVMCEIGYGYSRMEALNVASDYAFELNLREKEHPLTLNWLYSYLDRWPELNLRKQRGLEISRAKSATRPAIDAYFGELDKILVKYNLKSKPNQMFNIDEKGLSTDHKPPKIISGVNYKAQAITSGTSKTTTVIGAANGAGQQVPPYFVFAGKRMVDGLMDRATPGAAGTMSESGWSNTEIFEKYMKHHLLNYLPARSADSHVLVMYDGHTSHVSLSLIEWAMENFIILFLLPPHCSHLLQHLDVSCYGQFEVAWNAACHRYLGELGGTVITRYDECQLVCKVYSNTLTPSNIQAAFKRCGIYPFDATVIDDSVIAPSLTFPQILPLNVCPSVSTPEPTKSTAEEFLERRGGAVLNNVKVAKVRRTLSKVVGGKPITEDCVVNAIKTHIYTVSSKRKGKTNPTNSKHNKTPIKKAKKAAVIPEDTADSDSEMELPESDKCSVRHRFSPDELKHNMYIILVTWGKCDKCEKWVHLKFCTPVRVLRKGDSFLCPSCQK